MTEPIGPRARRRAPGRVDPHAGTRVEACVKSAELGAIVRVLREQRDQVLAR